MTSIPLKILLQKETQPSNPRVFITRYQIADPNYFDYYPSAAFRMGTQNATDVPASRLFVSMDSMIANDSAAARAEVITGAQAADSNIVDGGMINVPDLDPNISALATAAISHIAHPTSSLLTNYNLVSGVLGVANGLNDAGTVLNNLVTVVASILSALESKKILVP